MAIDPRTLRQIEQGANCHLIPESFGVSNVTVWLDGDFDSGIGTTCDAELLRYFQVFLGDRSTGRVALGSGSRSLKAVHSVGTHTFLIPKPRGGTFSPPTSFPLLHCSPASRHSLADGSSFGRDSHTVLDRLPLGDGVSARCRASPSASTPRRRPHLPLLPWRSQGPPGQHSKAAPIPSGP